MNPSHTALERLVVGGGNNLARNEDKELISSFKPVLCNIQTAPIYNGSTSTIYQLYDGVRAICVVETGLGIWNVDLFPA